MKIMYSCEESEMRQTPKIAKLQTSQILFLLKSFTQRDGDDSKKVKPVACIISFTTSYLRHYTELSRYLWMLSTETSFNLYDGVKSTS